MELTKHRCDVCGAEEFGEDYKHPKGWLTARISAKDKDFWEDHRDICTKCNIEAVNALLKLKPQ